MPFTQDFARSLVGAVLVLAIVAILSVLAPYSATLTALPSILADTAR